MSAIEDDINLKLKLIEDKLTNLENKFKQLEDLIIEVIVSDKICLTPSSSSNNKTKQLDLLAKDDLRYKKIWDREIQNQLYKELNKSNFNSICEQDKLKQTPNQLTIFKWLYSHFLDIRTEFCEKFEHVFINNEELYNTKKGKSLVELFKTEAIELHKKMKDDKNFKLMLNDCKKKYDKLLNI